MQNTLEELRLTEQTNEPQPEPSETTSSPEPEIMALVPTEPDVIEGEVIEIEPPETSEDHTPQKAQPYWLLIPLTILLCLVFVAVSFLVPLLTPSATITIVPNERTISATATIQVQGRMVPTLTLSQSITAPATGKRHQAATQAQGIIMFYNGLLSSQTITAGTILTGNDGVHVITDQAAVIPAANPPLEGQVTVSAHALLQGAQGNIPAYDINQACCATSVLAKNTNAFTGGENERNYLVATKADLDAAETTIKATLDRSEQAALAAQVNAGENLTPPLCSEKVLADHRPGDEAKEITVTVSEMCEATAYDAHKVNALAMQLLTSDATRKLGANYSLIGDIQVNIVHAIITDREQGSVIIAVKVSGVYVYQITPTMKQHLVRLIAGKPKQQAVTTLLLFPGIQAASINGNAATLPQDPGRITIVVVYRSA